MNVREAAALMGADITGLGASLFDNQIKGFSIDSRSVGAGELFFALSQQDYTRAGFNGEFVDAHRYIRDARSPRLRARIEFPAILSWSRSPIVCCWLKTRLPHCSNSRIAFTKRGPNRLWESLGVPVRRRRKS